jgi:hypothetical protein
MNFDEWFEEFSKNKDLTNMSIKDIARISFEQGIFWYRMNSPLYVKDDAGLITEVPREIEDCMTLPDDWVWDESDVDIEKLTEEQKEDNVKK